MKRIVLDLLAIAVLLNAWELLVVSIRYLTARRPRVDVEALIAALHARS